MEHNAKKNNLYEKIFSALILAGTIVAVIICFVMDLGERNTIVFLPLAFCCCYFLCFPNRRFIKNISLTIINISGICRYILYPIIIAITIGKGDFYYFDKNVVWLLIYELMGVFLIIGLFAKKLDIPEHSGFSSETNIGAPNAFLIAAFVPILALFPSLWTRFSLSSGVDKASSTVGFVEVFFTMGIWVVFLYFLVKIRFAGDTSRSRKILRFILVVAVAVYYILFNTISGEDVKRWQIIACGVAMIYVVIKLFPEKKKTILIFGTIGILLSVIIGSFIKFKLDLSFSNFWNKYFELNHFTEYFGGMRNLTFALDCFSNNFNAQGVQSTLTDLFSGVPVLSSLFNYDVYSTPAIFQQYMGRTDIICPLTAQSIAHFGYLGTPILAMLMTYFALIFNRALKRTDNIYSAYVLIELIVFFSLFMELNTTIILGKLWVRLMFLLLQPIDKMTKFRIKWRGVQ